MPKSSKPHWLKRDNIPEDPYEFEEHDARSLSDGKIGATPGSGRLFPGQLDSEVGDFKTDNKVTKHDSYGLNKWFWWERIEKAKGKVAKGFKMPLVDGDDKDYKGYQDHYSIKATTKKRPTLVNRDKTPIVEEDGILYSGCYVNASIDVWVMDNSYGKKVLASLNAIQFVKDGEPFGEKSEGADCFSSLDDDDDFLS